MHVLSTPNLTLFCEMACYEAVHPEFDDRTSSVGIHNDLYHLAATPVGEEIVITATVTEIDRRKLTFGITGHETALLIDLRVPCRTPADKYLGAPSMSDSPASCLWMAIERS